MSCEGTDRGKLKNGSFLARWAVARAPNMAIIRIIVPSSGITSSGVGSEVELL